MTDLIDKISGKTKEEEKEEKKEEVKAPERKFVILVDYENLEKGLKGQPEKLNNFSWLIDPILEEGVIVMAVAFFPDIGYPPIGILGKRYNFFCVVCPVELGDRRSKHVDDVDHRMEAFGMKLLSGGFGFTDLIIVAGDWDFKALGLEAKYATKRVVIISARDALSGGLKKLFEVKEI